MNKLYQGQDLTKQESMQLFDTIIKGELDSVLLSAALIAFKIKKETSDEIAGAALALTQNAAYFPRPDYDFADIVGTGGDGANTINISTMAAFVAAACGVKIAKHGNRGVSSKSGSSDLIAALGIDLTMNANIAREALDSLGICFLFAPHYHQGVRHAMPVRQTLKTRTLFNLIGPLINPAKPNIELMGVYDEEWVVPIADTMRHLGFKRAAVIHGSGLDEVAIHGTTTVAEIKNNEVSHYQITPEDFGLKRYLLSDITGGTPAENKDICCNILQGKGTDAQQSAVAINVALLLKLFGQEDLKANAQQALDIMRSGSPYQLAQQLASWSH